MSSNIAILELSLGITTGISPILFFETYKSLAHSGILCSELCINL